MLNSCLLKHLENVNFLVYVYDTEEKAAHIYINSKIITIKQDKPEKSAKIDIAKLVVDEIKKKIDKEFTTPSSFASVGDVKLEIKNNMLDNIIHIFSDDYYEDHEYISEHEKYIISKINMCSKDPVVFKRLMDNITITTIHDPHAANGNYQTFGSLIHKRYFKAVNRCLEIRSTQDTDSKNKITIPKNLICHLFYFLYFYEYTKDTQDEFIKMIHLLKNNGYVPPEYFSGYIRNLHACYESLNLPVIDTKDAKIIKMFDNFKTCFIDTKEVRREYDFVPKYVESQIMFYMNIAVKTPFIFAKRIKNLANTYKDHHDLVIKLFYS